MSKNLIVCFIFIILAFIGLKLNSIGIFGTSTFYVGIYFDRWYKDE